MSFITKKKPQSTQPLPQPEIDNDSEDSEYSDSDGIEDDGFLVTEETIKNHEFIFENLIRKVRNVVKVFRKSPTKNAILQKYVREEFNQNEELNLILDCNTRWSSLANMLERVVRLKNPIQKARIDIKLNIEITDEEFEKLGDLSKIFQIIKITVEELCKRNANLITADTACLFMLKKLDSMKHQEIAGELLVTLKRRIRQRRLLIAGTLTYLHNPQTYFNSVHDDYSDVFLNPNNDQMRTQIVIVNQLDSENISPLLGDDSAVIADISPEPEYEYTKDVEENAVTIKKELEIEIKKKIMKQTTKTINDDINKLVRIEMALYENGDIRGKYLENAYNTLSSIPPTSVESERVFSSAGYLCNHLRSKLSDNTLDKLLFLRSYYLKTKDK